jgi:hypothetical protein
LSGALYWLCVVVVIYLLTGRSLLSGARGLLFVVVVFVIYLLTGKDEN